MTDGAATHIGLVSKVNEDNYLADPSTGLWIVSDGLGGHERGHVASCIAVDTIANAVRNGATLEAALSKAHEAVLAHDGDMAATAVVLKLDGTQYEVAWSGDSRAYLFNGELYQLTVDHTYIQRLVDEGEMSAEDARVHPERSILTQALGAADGIAPESVSGQLSDGALILLCSDGLTDEVDDDQIASVLAMNWSEQEKVDHLIRLALDHGGRDNVTVALGGWYFRWMGNRG